jgi:hypothetical protein
VAASVGSTTTFKDVRIKSALRVDGTTTQSGALTLTVPLTKANANVSIKRQTLIWYPATEVPGGTVADSTTYRGYLPFNRAVTITKVGCLCGVAPIGGVNAVKVLKASSAGNTQLSAASFDPTTLANDVITSVPLSAVSADLGMTATQGSYLEWASGVQTTDAVNCAVTVEYELDDL